MVISWNVLVSPPLRPALGLCENYVRARNGPQGLEHELYPANLDYALHSRDWAMRGGGLLGASPGEVAEMCFYKEGPARVLPSMQKGFRRPGGGLGREGSYPGLLEKESPSS